MGMQDINIEGFQLSPQQRRLWRLTTEQPGDSPYVALCTVSIRGLVDVDALGAVLDHLPARHEILRTSFYASEEMSAPLQVIAPAGGARSVVFNLTSAGAGEHLLTMRLPALLCDATGLENLVRDIAGAYDARVRALEVTGDALQYADASAWLNETLESADTAAGRRFWESQDVAGLLRARLPFERERTTAASFVPRRVSVRLSTDSLAAARVFTDQRDVPPDTFVLACWQCLLQRTLDSDRVVVGYMSSGRNYAELEAAVGLFARCLPLSGDMPEVLRFDEAVDRLARGVRDVTQWAECFDWRLTPHDRVAATTPVVPLLYEPRLANGPHAVGDVVFEIEDAHAYVDRFTLKLCCRSSASGIDDTWLEYDAAACEEEDVLRMAAQLETLVAAAAANPASAIGELRVLPTEQEHEIVRLSRSGAESAAIDSLVHQRFEQEAARLPAAVAVVCEDVALTYAELNARSNQLARHLQSLGVGPDVLVGLCVERSVEFLVGILGIMKAGGAYVPLDPLLPTARLGLMLQESGASLVVSRSALIGQLPSSARPVLLDRDRASIEAWPSTNVDSTARPGNLAYVLFTSGSTGTPKGVAIEHRQLASYVHAVSDRLDIPRGAAFATVTTFGADLGHTAIYPALTTGGQLHIITEDRAADPDAFGAYVDRHPIDVLKIVPSHLKALLCCSRPERFLPRQRLVLGGEACPWELVDEVRRLAPGCVVFNHYGPTETTVGATVYRVPDNLPDAPSGMVPIGRPLDHARVYVLDRHLEIVPFWVAGELHVAGAGVARGYLTDAELTAQKFVRNRWSDDAARMYRTGDRVRMRPDGVIEFIGRIDSQLKIRGFRVEPGEVEAALRRHPSVKAVAVLGRHGAMATSLAAFLVYRVGPRPRSVELRDFLQQQGLPDYMCPAAFVPIDALPVTSNGKLDGEQLLATLDQPSDPDEGDDRLTEWESTVADVWQEFLAVERVQARDNFYDLGGDSLMAIQVVSALERRARVQISPRDLVFHTLKQFAALCASKNQESIST